MPDQACHVLDTGSGMTDSFMSTLMLFIDGIGIGENNPDINPFARSHSQLFTLFQENDRGKAVIIDALDSAWIRSLDCRMGVEGLPQSATGQTALFTGVNTSGLIGRHLSGFPTRRLKQILKTSSIMVKLENAGHSVVFANAFTPPYFKGKINRVSATTAMAQSCKSRIRNFEDLEKGGAVFMDLTNQWLIEKGYWITSRTVEEAANVLANIARKHGFTLFEYFITDVIGHRGDMESAMRQVRIIEDFVIKTWESMDHEKDLLIVVSDHGNLEDVTLRTHTMNRIPVIAAGRRSREFIEELNSIVDIAPALLAIHLSQERQHILPA